MNNEELNYKLVDTKFGKQIVSGGRILLKFSPTNSITRMTGIGSFVLQGYTESLFSDAPIVDRFHVSSQSEFEKIVIGMAFIPSENKLIVQYYHPHQCRLKQKVIPLVS
jgi:hypothetical protein